MQQITINPPEGYEVCPSSTKTEIRFRPVSNSKPKWEDFGPVKGWYIDNYSDINDISCNAENTDRNIWPTKEEAEACLALSQLCQWRDKYNEGWKPDWKDSQQTKWVISVFKNKIVNYATDHDVVLSFKTSTIRDKFLEDFEELIEIAKPLL